jgi:hypothetical protein
MDDENKLHEEITETINCVPLYLVPKTISDLILKKRDAVTLITIDRGFNGCFTVIIKTRDDTIPKVRRKGPMRPEGDHHD